jgi:hypothetical protein
MMMQVIGSALGQVRVSEQQSHGELPIIVFVAATLFLMPA